MLPTHYFYFIFQPGDATSRYLSDRRMMTVITEVHSDEATDQMFIESLGIPANTVQVIRRVERDDREKVLFECLSRWRNKLECDGKDAENELNQLMQKLHVSLN